MRVPTLALCAMLAVVLSLSCGDDDTATGPDPNTPFPHAVPSVQTMDVDTEDLYQEGGKGEMGFCHAVSAIAVIWIDLNVRLRLLIPTAAFAACVAQDPVYVGESTWRWTATGGAGQNAWTGELTARIVPPARVDWGMRVSGTQQGYNRLLWFDGSSDFAASQGSWHYYDPSSPDAPREAIRCDWHQFSGPELVRWIEFRNVAEGEPGHGDLLRYELVAVDASILLVDESAGDSTRVAWNLQTGAGEATNPDGVTCCWGERPLHPDIDCP